MADLDGEIETADENPALEGDVPAEGGMHDEASLPAGAGAEPAADAMTPLRNLPSRPAAADSLLQWLSEGDTSLDGKRLALVDLLSRVTDRPQQALLIATYWKLSAAVAEYRIAADESLRFEQLLPPADPTGKHASDPLLETRLAAAEAHVREAELAVLTQQYALAEQMRLPVSEPLPLASDVPHAGAYRTYFQERYARVAPPRSHLIDRSLPLLHRSIELRSAAALSAADRADAEAEAYHAGQLDLLSAIDGIGELGRERRAFVAAVRDYNLDIAEYALGVVPGGLTSAQLVGILIGPPPAAESGKSDPPKQLATEPSGVRRAGFEAPAGAPSQAIGAPTLAPPRAGTARKPPADGTPGRGPRRAGSPASPQNGGAAPRIKSVSPGATSRLEIRRHRVAKPPVNAAPAEPAEQNPATEAAQNAADQGLYNALADLSPVKRAQELSATLHWNRPLTAEQGTIASLTDALTASAGVDRRLVVEAYWRACEEVAAWQVVKQEAELLQSLQAAALKLHDQPGGAEAMLGLRTAQLASEAAVEESTVGVLAAQFALAQLMRRPLDGPWPWPVTPPHAGGYRLKLDAQSATVAHTSLVRQLGKSLPARHEILQRHAAAVTAADAARVEMALGFEEGARRLSDAVASVRQLASETLAFLDAQAQYNVQFADYVLAVAPPGLPASTLSGVLVVTRLQNIKQPAK